MSDINVGAISEALNNKVDLPSPTIPQDAVDYVIEMQRPTADNDYIWYRKYKSGWVEQGGQLSTGGSGDKLITLPVEMSGTNYAAIAIRKSGASTTTNVNVWARAPASSTTFNVYASGDTAVNWFVSGMSAS